MSQKQVHLKRAHCAQKSFEHHLFELRVDLKCGVSVKHLWVRVELLEELVERTGGTVLTEAYRVALADVKKMVALRAHVERRNRNKSKLEVVT